MIVGAGIFGAFIWLRGSASPTCDSNNLSGLWIMSFNPNVKKNQSQTTFRN
jgi:hypothetical protein